MLEVWVDKNVFFWNKKTLMLIKAALIWYKIKKTVLLWILLKIKITVFYLNMFLNFIYSGDGNAEFSAAITPVFSFTWSFCSFKQLRKQLCCLILIYEYKIQNKYLFEIENFVTL